MKDTADIATKVIHAGKNDNDQYGSLATPLYQTSTFIFDNAEQGAKRFAGETQGYIYSRLGNPTTRELELKLASLENMEDAAATATGMAAVSAALLANLSAGDHLIACKALYGCSYAFIKHQLSRFGVSASFVDMSNKDEIEAAVRPNTKVIFLETPINPTMEVIDLQMIADISRQHQLISIVDNTFLTPILQQPQKYGIDIVVHSATKYLNGHGDVVAGIVCGSASMIEHIKSAVLKDFGGTISPHDAWLIIRGLKTLAIRIERHCASAQRVAEFLQQQPWVKTVYYPGLASHPGHGYVGSQMKASGGVIAFELEGDIKTAEQFINHTQLFSLAVSLGDAESLIQHPASMTHSAYDQHERQAAGISDTLIRMSVGLECVDDLIEDLIDAYQQSTITSIRSVSNQ
ncbi:aminotransferase class I/II-fold pyridoxal phosphate-dependent enzyme [Thalassotalea ponticola]|uniref:trans-sulfuration enzyme family protein n=1 Tax=Thalassotalea ponticola TaxID=1523392 RepID=UPI0025B2FB9D|nr:aminotransferase class I/II-fold pyridoxal phosphate-dependent enzyme [Thalassotalea ponticola]MDN3653944.1 aminotransferase class I/II-fold pyridoxal phosphate-dependent enzyme [Thalassotalea ponticola]